MLKAALAAASDVGTLATLLSGAAGEGTELDTIDPLAEAMARGAAVEEELLREAGGALGVRKVARALGVSRQAVDKRRRRGTLLAVPAAGEYRYPACQFTEDGVLAGLAEVLASFQVDDPWTRLSVLLAPALALDGRSALDALRAGDAAGAAAVARAFGEQGA